MILATALAAYVPTLPLLEVLLARRLARRRIKTQFGRRPRKSRNLPDDMLAGAEPRSWNVAR